jgi:hypothetical protein
MPKNFDERPRNALHKQYHHAMTEEFEVHHQKSTPYHQQGKWHSGSIQKNYGERAEKDL